MHTLVDILVIEPNQTLLCPYKYIPYAHRITHTRSTDQAITILHQSEPTIILTSASYKPAQILRLLKAVKLASTTRLIPILVVVDLSHRLNYIIGTSWAGKLAVTDSQVPQDEFLTILTRLLQHEQA